MFLIKHRDTKMYWFGFNLWTDKERLALTYNAAEAGTRVRQLSAQFGPCEIIHKQIKVFDTQKGFLVDASQRISNMGANQT